MGEVYRATDTNLKRAVAIKVLPASVAADAGRLARFQREAEVLAALNHVNIAAIYGLEKNDSMTALVLELVEGPTLADRIANGPIPLDEALQIGEQVAMALEAAHQQGIVHRDLKPGNIKIRTDGTVKVLDFGLAKALEPAGTVSPGVSIFTTITTPANTQAGAILGTPAYMSPEQARGKPVDKRADIWSFGCVLFEMLTGRRAFPGEDVTDTLAAVVKSDPEWSALGTDVPPRVRQALRACLQKDPRNRLRDFSDVRLELQDAVAEAGQAPVAAQSFALDRRGIIVLAAMRTGMALLLDEVTTILVRPVTPRLDLNADLGEHEGPRVIDVDRALSLAARRAVFVATPAARTEAR
jgi:serine/threonine-protein kinase